VTPTPNPDGSQGALTLQVGTGPTAWSATWSQQYDDHQRLARVTNSRTGASTTWTYDSEGRLARQETQTAEHVSIVYTTYEYDAAGRLTAQRNYKGDGTLLSAFTNITYDGKGNRTGCHMNITTLPQASFDRSHSYTTQDRLASDTLSANGAPLYTHNYAYDTAGNPTTFNGETRRYNLNNQLDAYLPADKADTPANWVSEAFVYDEEGNPTTYKGETCTYNAHGNLLSYGTTLTAGYNADGLRIWKESAGQRSYYLYDGETLLAETDAAGTVTSVYTWGANGLICRDAAAGSTYYLYDPQGSVVQRVDAAGAVTDTDLYDAWGNKVQGNPASDPVGYCGQHGYYTDAETGLVLCTHRYYDPTLGRWVTRDPIGSNGGLNIYGYCKEDPVGNVDQSGFSVYVYRTPVEIFPNSWHISRHLYHCDHWFFYIDNHRDENDGCVGYGDGIMWGFKENAGPATSDTWDKIKVSDSDEVGDKIWKLCKNVEYANIHKDSTTLIRGILWSKENKSWYRGFGVLGDRSSGEYSVMGHNCQDFIINVLWKLGVSTSPLPQSFPFGYVWQPVRPNIDNTIRGDTRGNIIKLGPTRTVVN